VAFLLAIGGGTILAFLPWSSWSTLYVFVACPGTLILHFRFRSRVTVEDGIIRIRNLRTYRLRAADVVSVEWYDFLFGKGERCPAIRLRDRRRAVALVALYGRSPNEAASILGCPVRGYPLG
jgi:hypothetical protein